MHVMVWMQNVNLHSMGITMRTFGNQVFEEDIWVRKKWWTRRLNSITQHASWFAFSS